MAKYNVSVASVAYNLAGPEEGRPKFLQALLASTILQPSSKASISESLQSGYMRGPGMKFRSFFNWTQQPGNYDTVGQMSGRLQATGSLSESAVADEIPHSTGETVWVQRALLQAANYVYWVEQWFLKNAPEKINYDYTAEINNVTKVITITFDPVTYPDEDPVSFTASGFNLSSSYIYAWYSKEVAGVIGSLQLFIYRIGSGRPALDAMVNDVESYGQFYPVIPVRYNNVFIDDYSNPVYEQAKKAYKKSTGGDFDELIDKISDNPDLNDIDYAFVVFGVSLNAKDNSCKRYLYKFLERLQASQVGGPNLYELWKIDYEANQTAWDTWEAWYKAKSNPEDPLYGTPEPTRPTSANNLPTNQILMANTGSFDTDYAVTLSWAYVANGTGAGKGKVGAKKGDLWWEKLPSDTFISKMFGGNNDPNFGSAPYNVGKVRLYWQRENDSYTYLDVVGLTYSNNVYFGYSVGYGAETEIENEDESSFIIPLHYDTYRETSLIHTSQMANASAFIVFNSYEVKKKKWYEKGIFQILMIVVVIVIAVVGAIFSGGATIGLLGTALSVGTAMGLTGMAAIVAGAVVNALAGIVLSMLLQSIAVGIFGPELGGIIAAVLGMVIGNVMGGISSTGTFALDWGSLINVENLLKLTNALAQGYVSSINAGTAGLATEMQEYSKKSQAEADKIQQAFFKEFGYGNLAINPLMFVQSATIFSESSDTFLTRTLLTGSEISEISRDLLYNFAEYSMKLPDAYT